MIIAIDPHLAHTTTSRPDPSFGPTVTHAAELIAALTLRGRELCPSLEVTVAAGAGGAAFVMPEHLDALQTGQIDALIFGGVHSDYDPSVIAALEAQGRLYTPNNLDALIPGETAAFALSMRPDFARRASLEPWACLHGVGSGFEQARPDNEHSAYEAKGLTLAVRAATQELVSENRRAGWALTDLTFAMRRIYEWQSMLMRSPDIFDTPYMIDSPAQRIGHLGAAALPLHMALAAVAYRRNYAPDPLVVAFAGSDSGERGALLMGAP